MDTEITYFYSTLYVKLSYSIIKQTF